MLRPRLINVALVVVASLLTACSLFTPPPRSYVVSLSDVDRDGDFDAFVGNKNFGQIWVNDGAGRFTDSGQRFDWSSQYAVNLADVDGDGDKDVFAIRFDGDVLVWHNNGTGRFGRGDWTMAPIYLAVGGVVVLGLILLGWRVIRRKEQS